MLGNGVIVFDGGGELLPDGRAVAPDRPAPAVPLAMAAWVVMTLMTSCTKAQRAHENRAYVRELLWKREPAFAAELATAEQDFPCPACPCRWCSCSTARCGAPAGTSHWPPTKLYCCPQLTDRGVALVAVSPQTPNGLLSTQEKGADVQRRDQCRQHLAATSAS